MQKLLTVRFVAFFGAGQHSFRKYRVDQLLLSLWPSCEECHYLCLRPVHQPLPLANYHVSVADFLVVTYTSVVSPQVHTIRPPLTARSSTLQTHAKSVWIDRQMVQGLQEEMEGVKTQLKRRRSSPAEGEGSTRHPKARRGSKGSPFQARPEKRGPSSSPPSALDSDHDNLGSGEWSSSDDEARRRGGGRGDQDAHHHHRRLSAPARGRGAMEQGYYPYGGPPRVYPGVAPLFYPPMYPGYGGGGGGAYATGMPMGIQVSGWCFRSKTLPFDADGI